MFKICLNKKLISCFIIFFALSSCAKEGFFKTGDARKNSPDPKLRVKKNLEEGRGFRINNASLRVKVTQILNLQVLTNYGEHL